MQKRSPHIAGLLHACDVMHRGAVVRTMKECTKERTIARPGFPVLSSSGRKREDGAPQNACSIRGEMPRNDILHAISRLWAVFAIARIST